MRRDSSNRRCSKARQSHLKNHHNLGELFHEKFGVTAKGVIRMVNTMISIRFPRSTMPHICSTLRIRGNGRHLILRIRRRLNNNVIHAVTVNSSSNLHHNLSMGSLRRPVRIPMNGTALNHVVGMLNRPISVGNRVNRRRH